MLVFTRNENPSLLRNDIRGKRNWIKAKLEGVKSNRGSGSGPFMAGKRFERFSPAFRPPGQYFSGRGNALAARTCGVLQTPANPSAGYPARGPRTSGKPRLVEELNQEASSDGDAFPRVR